MLCTYNYSAIKEKETLSFATTWMNLEDTVLSEINPRQRDKHGMIAFISEIFKSETHRTESRMMVARGWGVGEIRRYLSKGTNFHL